MTKDSKEAINVDDLGDRMKLYEGLESNRILLPRLPILARLDGRAFHTFLRHSAKPFSHTFHRMMVNVTGRLMRETGASFGYTQSDEISLAWYSFDVESEPFFGGNVMKMTSTLAAIASVELNCAPKNPKDGLAWHVTPTFDCRVWTTPTLAEAANVFIWRQWDARRNSISAAAQAHFSHNELLGVGNKQKLELLAKRGVNWEDYEAWAKYGTMIQRFKRERRYHAEEIEKLPEKHAARSNPDLTVVRTDYREAHWELVTLQNRSDVLFKGADPEASSSTSVTSITSSSMEQS